MRVGYGHRLSGSYKPLALAMGSLTLHYGRVASHTAVLVAREPDYLIHAASDAGCVVHQRLSGALAQRVRGIYTFPGVDA